MKYLSMKVVVDYDPVNLEFISFIPNNELDIKGRGECIEESVNNMLNAVTLLHKSIKSENNKISVLLERWISELSLVGKVKILFTRTLYNNIRPIMIGKVRSELIKEFYK